MEKAVDRRRYQFSLWTILVVTTVVAVTLGAFLQLPRWLIGYALFALFLVFPLFVASLVRQGLVWFGLLADLWTADEPYGRSVAGLARDCLRGLGLARAKGAKSPSLRDSLLIAAIYSLTLVGLWPALREIGLQISMSTFHSGGWTLTSAWQSFAEAVASGGYWLRLIKWESWSLGRWWLLFGLLTLLMLALAQLVSRLLSRPGWRLPVAETLARWLAFAPWLVALEMAFLIGVWIRSPNTVPEPSTGFVVGIFNWGLWHWDAWLDHGWLVRGAVPTIIVASVFFVEVTRWPWWLALVAAILLIPVTLLLSIATTVAYQNGFPW
ncbi:MAG: hypothetical protein MUF06_23410 [Pirellulaceae bacterium]|nr:hypothetical protein [Pirellulaceae bacterium]